MHSFGKDVSQTSHSQDRHLQALTCTQLTEKKTQSPANVYFYTVMYHKKLIEHIDKSPNSLKFRSTDKIKKQ